MTKMVWDIIKESKGGKPYLNSEEQYKNFKELLSQLDKETVEKVYEEWTELEDELRCDEFEKLDANYGGMISVGLDGFYIDFANWVLVQGEELLVQFKKEGHQAIMDYIQKHSVPKSDYSFECMGYAFHDFVDMDE